MKTFTTKHHKITSFQETKYIYFDPLKKHDQTLIFLHGLGDTAAGFVDLFAQIEVVSPSTRIILPTAPSRPVTINGGMKMPSWYDFGFPPTEFDKPPEKMSEEEKLDILRNQANQEDLIKSADFLQNMINEELSRFADGDPARIFIGGFSQGAAVCLATWLRYKGENPLGGVVALSGAQALKLESARLENKSVQRRTPMFIYHGAGDMTIPIQDAMISYNFIFDQIYESTPNNIKKCNS